MILILTLTYPDEVKGVPVTAVRLGDVAQAILDEWAAETRPAGIVTRYDIIR